MPEGIILPTITTGSWVFTASASTTTASTTISWPNIYAGTGASTGSYTSSAFAYKPKKKHPKFIVEIIEEDDNGDIKRVSAVESSDG